MTILTDNSLPRAASAVKLTVCCAVLLPMVAAAQVVIDGASLIPPDPRQRHARFVRFRPGDEQAVTLNPPRFSWPYLKELPPKEKRFPGGMRYTLQIAIDPGFANPEVLVEKTLCNFYNFLPELKGARKWHWRVGYHHQDGALEWSDARSFTIADHAVVWDRSALANLRQRVTGHPRLLFNADSIDDIRRLRETHDLGKEMADYIIARANTIIGRKPYVNFPTHDKKPGKYMALGRDLVVVAFAHVLTRDAKYEGHRERFLGIASWPKGGFSSPEGIVRDKWSTHLTEYLGLFYDWFYHDLHEHERATVRESLEWRIDHTMNNFAWMRRGGTRAFTGSIAVACGSHPYENTMVTLPGALAIYDESEIARRAFDLGLNYIIGITNGMGEDEGWNEGPGYGNGKMKWLMDATCYLSTAIPELHLERNEAYSAYGDFFARITPIAAQHCSFGNRGINERDWCSSRVTNFLRLALLRQDGRFLYNWQQTRRRLKDVTKRIAFSYSPWVDYALLHYHPLPKPRPESDPVKLFPLEGWVTASSAAPSDYDAQKDGVSMTFHCRPRGGHSHSFRNENAFDIHAYGSTITCGGGSTSNQSFFANHTMSHNTVLVGGREQRGARGGVSSRIIAFHRGRDFVYWAGDATPAYAAKTGLTRFIRHVVFVRNAYFVIFDDLALAPGAKPTTFQWLYHVYPAVPIELDNSVCSARYGIGATQVHLQHCAHVDDLTLANRRGVEGMVNPVTGEDLTQMGKWNKDGRRKNPKPLDAHHLWVSHRSPCREMQFLAVIVPYRQNDTAPTVQDLDARAVRVTFRGKTEVIAFQPVPDADVLVNTEAIAKAAGDAVPPGATAEQHSKAKPKAPTPFANETAGPGRCS